MLGVLAPTQPPNLETPSRSVLFQSGLKNSEVIIKNIFTFDLTKLIVVG